MNMDRWEFDNKMIGLVNRFKKGDKQAVRAYHALFGFYYDGTNFDSMLIRLAQKADLGNRAVLSCAFPDMIELWELCEHAGFEEWYDLKGFMALFNE